MNFYFHYWSFSFIIHLNTLSKTVFELVGYGLHIVGSLVGTVQEMRELVQLAADGKVKTHIGRTASLSEINQVFEELEKGTYVGRAIIDNIAKWISFSYLLIKSKLKEEIKKSW